MNSMEQMLEAFGAREKYELIKDSPTGDQEAFRQWLKDHHNYRRDLLAFATQWDKDHPPEDESYYTCRDHLRHLEGRQSTLNPYQCLRGRVPQEEVDAFTIQRTEEYCYPPTVVLCG